MQLYTDPLPVDIVQAVMIFCDVKTLGRCGAVSQQWRAVSQQNFVWQRLFPNSFTFEQNFSIKKYVKEKNLRIAHSLDALPNLVDRFYRKILKANCNGVFNCIFSCNAKAKFNIKTQIESTWVNSIELNYLLVDDFESSDCHGCFKMTNSRFKYAEFRAYQFDAIKAIICKYNISLWNKHACDAFLHND